MAKKVVRNDEGKVVPEHCSCGGKIGVFIEGEPIYTCTACGKYYGTMPFPKKTLNESLNKENKNMDKKVIKLNESQLRETIKKTIAKMLSEKWNPVVQNFDSYYNSYEPVVGINNGDENGKTFDTAGYEYDIAYQDAKDLDDLDQKLAQRKANIDSRAKFGQECHPQATPHNKPWWPNRRDGSFSSASYARSGSIDTLNGFKNIDDLVDNAVNESLKKLVK